MVYFIVESENDSEFLKAIVEFLKRENTHIGDLEFFPLGGLDPNPEKPTTLITRLKALQGEMLKKGSHKFGIVIDMDRNKEVDRLRMVNNAIKDSFPLTSSNTFDRPNEMKAIVSEEKKEFFSACHFMNIDGIGNLETVIKSVAIHEAKHANCMDTWRKCLQQKGVEMTQEEFDKVWLDKLVRFDISTKQEKAQAARKSLLTKEKFLNSGFFDLYSEKLDSLKMFLRLFADN